MRHRRFRIALCCFFLFLATTDSVARQNPQEDRSNRQMNTGVGLYSAGKLDAAIAAFQDAISTWPKNALAYFNLGTALASRCKRLAGGIAKQSCSHLLPAKPAGRRLYPGESLRRTISGSRRMPANARNRAAGARQTG